MANKMNGGKPTALLSRVIAAALLAMLLPATAFASSSELAAGSLEAQDAASGRTQLETASTTTIPVVTKISYDQNTYKISYTKGLVSKITFSTPSWSGSYVYGYKGKYVASYKNKMGWHENNGQFSYDKKNRLSKVLSGGSQGAMTYKESYKYDKKNRVSKMAHDRTGDVTNYTYKYDSKNRLSSKALKDRTGSTYTTTFAYDAKGNLKKVKESYQTQTRANTYKGGRLVKSVITDKSTYSTTSKTVTYQYKNVSVPKAYVAFAKKQQWAMLNYNASVGVIPVAPLYIS